MASNSNFSFHPKAITYKLNDREEINEKSQPWTVWRQGSTASDSNLLFDSNLFGHQKAVICYKEEIEEHQPVEVWRHGPTDLPTKHRFYRKTKMRESRYAPWSQQKTYMERMAVAKTIIENKGPISTCNLTTPSHGEEDVEMTICDLENCLKGLDLKKQHSEMETDDVHQKEFQATKSSTFVQQDFKTDTSKQKEFQATQSNSFAQHDFKSDTNSSEYSQARFTYKCEVDIKQDSTGRKFKQKSQSEYTCVQTQRTNHDAGTDEHNLFTDPTTTFSNEALRDPVSTVYKIAGKNRLVCAFVEARPPYGPPHRRTFTFKVTMGPFKFRLATGSSKKDAKRYAAENALTEMQRRGFIAKFISLDYDLNI